MVEENILIFLNEDFFLYFIESMIHCEFLFGVIMLLNTVLV